VYGWVKSFVITTPKNSNAHLASAWTAGIALLFLGVGLEGAMTPLVPVVKTELAKIDIGDEVMVEEFEAPASAPEAVAELQPAAPRLEVEIPPLPEITPPLTPPEMVELTPLEPVVENPAPPSKPVEAKPKALESKRAISQAPKGTGGSNGASGGSGEPQLFTGAGGGPGRFPAPSYPASARSEGIEGSLRLLVTVSASGLPMSVSVTSSSGHSILDSAAREHVQRNWRWPSGEVRRYIVPVRFVLR
jgi:protein TonB